MRLICSLIAVLLFASPTFAEEGEGSENTEAAENGLQEVSVDELAAMIAEGTATPCDANGQMTRERFGTIPGAVLLTSYSDFDVAELGGSDNTYVFYCSNQMCSAAPSAAERARAEGFADVRVLRSGIMGWVEAGQAVAQITPTE